MSVSTTTSFERNVNEVKEDEFSDLKVTSEELHTNLSPDLEAIPGFTNYAINQHYQMSVLYKKVQSAYEKYGFTQLHLRPLEKSCNILLKGGVGKQIFGVSRLADSSLTKLAIPFDRTVPFALFVASNLNQIPYPYRRYDINYSFRGEHASPGRFRAFYQADVDIVGKNLGLINDFECLGAMIEALRSMEIGKFTVCLNHIVIAKSMIKKAGVPPEKESEVLKLVDKLDKTPAEEIIKQVCSVIPEIDKDVVENLIKQFCFRKSPEEFKLDENFPKEAHQSLEDVKTLYKMLVDDAGMPKESLVLSPGMVRGLDYYTGIVFETFLEGSEQYGSIASGGRYAKLVDTFAQTDAGIIGVGGSIGLTRLFYILNENKKLSEGNRTTLAQVLVCYRTNELMKKAVQVATAFRNEGINTSLYSGDKKKIKNQLDYANSHGTPFSVMVMNENEIIVKNMNEQDPEKKQKSASTPEETVSAYKNFIKA